jgi:dienelactone hydrolase
MDELVRLLTCPARRVISTARMAAHAVTDAAVVSVGVRLHSFRDLEVLRVRREVRAAASMFEDRGWIDAPRSYHRDPPPMDPNGVGGSVVSESRWSGLDVKRIEIDSGYEPHAREPGRGRWAGYERNRRFHLRLVTAPEPSNDWMICIHGTGMGFDAVDYRAFDVRWITRDLGQNVALPVLPLSGPRKSTGLHNLQFPTNDQMDSVHGLAQAVWELRRTVDYLRAQGAETITVHGISLGGYVAALAASLVPGVDRVIAGIPASSLHLLFEERLGPTSEALHHESLSVGRRIHVPVDPLVLEPMVPTDSLFVYAGLVDRLAPRRRHAIPLWEHWGRPAHCWYPGGHVGFARSSQVRGFVESALNPPTSAVTAQGA